MQVSYTWVKVDHCRYVNDAAYEPLVLIDNRKKIHEHEHVSGAILKSYPYIILLFLYISIYLEN